MMGGLKTACQALSGKQPAMEDACQALSGKQAVDDTDVYLPLVRSEGMEGNGAFVRYLGPDPSASPAELVTDFIRGTREHEALAMPAPVTIEVGVPTGSWEPGQVMRVQGPDGFIRVPIPAGAAPGSKIQLRLAPKPEYRIQVPPGASPGWVVKFQKESGEEVAVSVPPGMQPGDNFEVTPPALMVRVPEQTNPGDFVIFKHQLPQKGAERVSAAFFRARIPEGCQPGDFFSAIMPKPQIE